MTDSVIYIEINRTPNSSFEKPLLRYIKEANPSYVTFDFDNFSEETIRQYAIDLVSQSRSAVIVVKCRAEEGPFTGLVQFFNRLQQLKHPQLMILQEGPLPPQLQKMMKVIGGDRYRKADDQLAEAKFGDQILGFLRRP